MRRLLAPRSASLFSVLVLLLAGWGQALAQETADELFQRGEASLATGDLGAAAADFQRAAARGHLPARYRVGELLLLQGNRAGAAELFDSFIDAYNQGQARSARDLVAVGDAMAQLGVTQPSYFQDAVRIYDEALETDPDYHPARVAMGRLFLAKYDSQEARALFREVLERDPGHPGALLGLAEAAVFDRSGDLTDLARQALDEDPAAADAYVLLARAALEEEDAEAAREALEEALAINPGHLPALSMQAATAFLQDDTTAWEAARDDVLARAPGYADLFATVGELSVQVRRYEDAARMGRRAVEVDSLSWEGWGLLGMNLLRVGEVKEGRQALERAFSGDPYNVWYKNSLDLLDEMDRYRILETEHFQLVLHPDEADLLGPEAAALAEEVFDSLSTRYGMEPPLPIRIEIFPRHADFSVRTLGLTGLGALGVSFGSVLTMDSPAARPRGSFNWGATLWHETAHAFHLAYTDHRIPRWFAEGMAVYEERRSRPGWGHEVSLPFLLALQDDRIRPVSDLNAGFMRPSYPEEVVVSYYVASLVCEYIADTRGTDALLRFLDGYRSGESTDTLTREILGTRPARFDREFAEYLDDRFGDYLGEGLGAATPDEAGDPHGGGGLHGGMGTLTPDQAREWVARDPGNGLAHLTLGGLLAAAGNEAEAAPHLERARELMPEYGGLNAPHPALARIYLTRRDTTAALEILTEYTGLNATAEGVFQELSSLRASRGDGEGAIDALERNVWIYPYEPTLHERLAGLGEEAGDWDTVIRARQALVALEPVDRSRALYELALAYRAAGDSAAARSTVLRALELAPNYDEALELLLELRGGGDGE